MLSQPEDLTNKIINKIGEDYYIRFPKGSLLTWMMHDNHDLADMLKNYGNNFNDMESSIRDKWDFLLKVYGKIIKPDGQLAKAIDELFKQAFGLTHVPKFKMCEGIPLELTTKMIVHKLKATVNARLPIVAAHFVEYK